MPKYRKMLNNWDAPYIQQLVKLLETQSKETIVNWGLDYCEENVLPIYKKAFPNDDRLENTMDAAKMWLQGEVKLPFVKNLILNEAHGAAREAEGMPAAQGAARCVGQVCSSIHAPTHIIGIALYGSLAIAYDKLGDDAPWDELENRATKECYKMYMSLQKVAVEDETNPAKFNWNC